MKPKNAMAEALQKRKARGLDLAIIVGGAEPMDSDRPIDGDDEKEEREALGLAPEATEIGDKETMQDEEVGKASHDALRLRPGEQMMDAEELPPKGSMTKATEHEAMQEEHEPGQDEGPGNLPHKSMGDMLAHRMGKGSLARRAMSKLKMSKK